MEARIVQGKGAKILPTQRSWTKVDYTSKSVLSFLGTGRFFSFT
jgi:hypothetical protein